VPFPAVESLTTRACQTWDPHVSDGKSGHVRVSNVEDLCPNYGRNHQ
jgi:hypothetical protein